MIAAAFRKKSSVKHGKIRSLLQHLHLKVDLRYARSVILLRLRDMRIQFAPHDDAGEPSHIIADESDILQAACSRIDAARNLFIA